MLARHLQPRASVPQRRCQCLHLGCWPVAAHTTAQRLHTRAAAQRQEREPFDEFTNRALREACDLLATAQQQAQDQTRAELLQSMQAGASGSTNNSADEAAEAAMTQTAMQSFWLEQGLALQQAEQLTRHLCDMQQRQQQHQQQQQKEEQQQDVQVGSTASWSCERLAAKLSTLQRVLADASVAHMVHREPSLLEADPAALVQSLLELLRAFPAGANVVEMVSVQPRLLLAADLGSRAAKTLDKLLLLHPSGDKQVVAGIVEENPELLFRIPDYYQDATLLDDLPIEVQNMMVHADQGIGWLHRYYRMKRQDAAAKRPNSANSSPQPS